MDLKYSCCFPLCSFLYEVPAVHAKSRDNNDGIYLCYLFAVLLYLYAYLWVSFVLYFSMQLYQVFSLIFSTSGISFAFLLGFEGLILPFILI